MCEEHGSVYSTFEPVTPNYPELPITEQSVSRRRLLQITSALGLSFIASNCDSLRIENTPPDTTIKPISPLSGQSSTGWAMHLHGSGSEGVGSIEGHFSEAQRTGVDAIVLTEHDWRMTAQAAPDTVGFDAGGDSKDRYGNPAWSWLRDADSRSLVVADGAYVSDIYSPNDETIPGSFHVAAVSAKHGQGSNIYLGYDNTTRKPHRVSLNTINELSIDVLPSHIGPDAWMEVRIMLSSHPAIGNRPAGQYELHYHLGIAGDNHTQAGVQPAYAVAKGLSAKGNDAPCVNVGIVNKPVQAGTWNTVSLDLLDDIGQIWPDLPYPADNSFSDIRVGATSKNGSRAEGYFDYLHFDRDVADNRPMEAMQALVTEIGQAYPAVTSAVGREISYGSSHHVNAFGGNQLLFDYRTVAGNRIGSKIPLSVLVDQIKAVHSSGGVTSYNHPFGIESGGTKLTKSYKRVLQSVTQKCLDTDLYGSDIIESGYVSRGKMDLLAHLALTNTLIRNGIWLTINGVSDDHNGADWDTMTNHMRTQVLTDPDRPASIDQLVTAMKTGRAVVSQIKSFNGMLDIQLDDGRVTMGQVSIIDKAQRSLQIAGAGLPSGGVIKIVQVPIDYRGNVATGVPFTSANIATDKLNTAAVWNTTIDTSQSSAVYAMCITQNKRGRPQYQAITNPIFALREMPPANAPYVRRIPEERLAADMHA